MPVTIIPIIFHSPHLTPSISNFSLTVYNNITLISSLAFLDKMFPHRNFLFFSIFFLIPSTLQFNKARTYGYGTFDSFTAELLTM
jgi:hypothetical protein